MTLFYVIFSFSFGKFRRIKLFCHFSVQFFHYLPENCPKKNFSATFRYDFFMFYQKIARKNFFCHFSIRFFTFFQEILQKNIISSLFDSIFFHFLSKYHPEKNYSATVWYNFFIFFWKIGQRRIILLFFDSIFSFKVFSCHCQKKMIIFFVFADEHGLEQSKMVAKTGKNFAQGWLFLVFLYEIRIFKLL